jgi:hypothetical protein
LKLVLLEFLFLFQYEWKCSICIRGSTNRDVPPSQSFLRASAAAQQRKQIREQQQQPQQQQNQQQQQQQQQVQQQSAQQQQKTPQLMQNQQKGLLTQPQKQQQQQQQQQQGQGVCNGPPSPKGMAAIINRVAKKQESFDAGGQRYAIFLLQFHLIF